MRLTRSSVARLSLPEGRSEAIYFDDGLPGFGLRVRVGGKRTWIAQYRVGTKQRRITLGTPETLSADDARDRAKTILASVHLGADPQAEKSAARTRAALTLGTVATKYLVHAQSRLRPRSFEEVERHLAQHWGPLREIPIHALTRRDIAERLAEIAGSRGPFAANRARATLSALFSWAMRQGEVEANPVIATGKATDEISRDRVLNNREIAAVWNSCGQDDYGRIVRLLFLTGQRREEVGAMRWSEIEPTIWRLPASRTKNRLPHDIPLSDAASALIHGVPRRDERDLIFGDGEGAFQGWSRAKANMDARIQDNLNMKMPPWRLHDIRRTVVTGMNEIGVLPHVVEAVVNHVTGPAKSGVAGVYNRAAYAAEKRAALSQWAEHLLSVAK